MGRAARFGIGAAIATIVVAMGVASATAPRGERVREQVARHVAAIDARIAARAMQRDVAWGEAEDGEAFAHYARAMQELRRVPRLGWNGTEFHRDGKPVTERAAREQRDRSAAGLAHLIAGARCRDARPRRLDGYSPLAAANATMCEVALRLRDGNEVEAVQLWLDAMTFEIDVDDFGLSTLLAQWRPEELQRLGAAAANLLAEGFRRLDGRLLVCVPIDEAVLPWVTPLLNGDYTRDDWHWREVAAAWRHGFAPDDRHLTEFAAWFDRGPRLSAALATGRARDAEWEAARAGWTTRSYLVSHALERAHCSEKSRRTVVTDLRMQRLALAWQHRQPPPDVVDPFTGEPFAMTRDGDTAMWVSAEHQGRRRTAKR